jgi:tricorn protease
MHGVDWAAMKKKYEPFLADLATRNDLNRVIQWMSRSSPLVTIASAVATSLQAPATIPGGLLGADYSVENGRYRFKRVLAV